MQHIQSQDIGAGSKDGRPEKDELLGGKIFLCQSILGTFDVDHTQYNSENVRTTDNFTENERQHYDSNDI